MQPSCGLSRSVTCADGVLVGVDLGPTSQAGIDFAFKHFAKRPLHVVYCSEPHPPYNQFVSTVPPLTSLLDQQKDTFNKFMGSAMMLHPGVNVTPHFVEGDARTEICALADKIDAEVVIVTSHGRGLLTRLLLGSVATYLVNHIRHPLVIIRTLPGQVVGEESSSNINLNVEHFP